MNTTSEAGGKRFNVLFLLGAAVLASTGCASRTVVITQEDRINNAMHQYRPPEQRTGDPLEVTIVCVYPDDLERDENGGLKPGSGITSKDWYEHQPARGGDAGRFALPTDQVYVLTNAAQVYGKRKGPALNGALKDGRAEVHVAGIRFPGMKLRNRNSAIYVFPKFIGADGGVLPVRAAEFSPPGAYGSKLEVRIGVDESRGHSGQYIEVTTSK